MGDKVFLVDDKGAITKPTYAKLRDLRMLASHDASHPWAQIADSEYGSLQEQSAGSPLLTPDFTVSNGGAFREAENSLSEYALFEMSADLADEVATTNDARARGLLVKISSYFKTHAPLNSVYYRDGSTPNGVSAGYAPVALTLSQVGLGEDGANVTYQMYIAQQYDSKRFLFRPDDEPGIQIALEDLLAQADSRGISLIKRAN